MHLKRARVLTFAAVAAVVLAGCGRTAPQLARPAALDKTAPSVAAKSVTPDKEYANDLKRALYWDSSAVLVAAIHTTALNSTGVSASANVFYSAERRYAGKTPLFVARHYGVSAVAQYMEIVDYADLAGGLAGIGAYKVKAEEAWRLAKNYQPVQPTPAPGATPAPQSTERFMLSSRAILIQPAKGEPTWRFVTGNQMFGINAQTGEIQAPSAKPNVNDYMTQDFQTNLLRAANIWLPTSIRQANDSQEPSRSN